MNLGSFLRAGLQLAVFGSAITACGGVSDDGLYDPSGNNATATGGTGGGACVTTGTWATFVQVGVEWSSATIKPGAGTVKQWIISERREEGGVLIDEARACGIGANGVPLGSAWFAIMDIPQLNIFNEWTGVEFLPALFDSGKLPAATIRTTVGNTQNGRVDVGAVFNTEATPFSFGFENLEGDWPTDINDLRPLIVDHDDDGHPGLTGVPFAGPVPGGDGIEFRNPRLGVFADPSIPIPRASAMYMGIRTQAALRGEVVSCNPVRVEGEVVVDSLRIDTHNVACDVADTNEACTEDQILFLDGNLPQFVHNGTSEMVSFEVPEGTTCAEIRAMEFVLTE